MAAKPGSRQDKVNKSSVALSRAKLGDVVAELVAQVNANTAKHNALVAKLDLDAGVTDTNYTALTGTPATVIKDMESR
jgi:hypothetical protein